MYHLLFDDDVYANMVQGAYDASQWMSIGDVRATATQLERSAKKFDELCRKGALLRGDVLSMERNGSDGITVSFSASVGQPVSIVSSRAKNGYFVSTDRRHSTQCTINENNEFSRQSLMVLQRTYRVSKGDDSSFSECPKNARRLVGYCDSHA